MHHRIAHGFYYARDKARHVEVISGRTACNSLSTQLRAATVGRVETQTSTVTSRVSKLINVAVIKWSNNDLRQTFLVEE